MNELKLLPGRPMGGPLPQSELKGTDYIANDIGGNSQVYPQKLTECREALTGGRENVWYEYLPDTYDGTQQFPLVISFHGGGMEGWGQCLFTSWTMLAEREKFIAVFPTASKDKSWQVNLDGGPIDRLGNEDLRFVLALLTRLKQKYKIDETRVYMQGMSMGDLMTMQFARAYGNLIAAAANSAGPSSPAALFGGDGNPKDYVCPMPVYQFRGEMDNTSIFPGYTRPEVNAANRAFWMKINGCCDLPEISISGFDNVAYYTGGAADFIYRDVKFRGHGQPLDDAEFAWRYLFSGCQRLPSGVLVRGEPKERFHGDKDAFALADGKIKAYVDNQPAELDAAPFTAELKAVEMGTAKIVETYRYLYVTVKTLAKLFGLDCVTDGKTAVLHEKDGRKMSVAAESIGCVVDGRLYSMSRQSEARGGALYVPVRWFAETLFNRFVTEKDGALYMSDHVGYMTGDMAAIIKEILA